MQVQLLLEMYVEAITLISLTPTGRGLGFLGVPKIMVLNPEVHTLGAMCMILVHVTTELLRLTFLGYILQV